jgi:hypothetical protein
MDVLIAHGKKQHAITWRKAMIDFNIPAQDRSWKLIMDRFGRLSKCQRTVYQTVHSNTLHNKSHNRNGRATHTNASFWLKNPLDGIRHSRVLRGDAVGAFLRKKCMHLEFPIDFGGKVGLSTGLVCHMLWNHQTGALRVVFAGEGAPGYKDYDAMLQELMQYASDPPSRERPRNQRPAPPPLGQVPARHQAAPSQRADNGRDDNQGDVHAFLDRILRNLEASKARVARNEAALKKFIDAHPEYEPLLHDTPALNTYTEQSNAASMQSSRKTQRSSQQSSSQRSSGASSMRRHDL